jgi:hypothetical protein
LEPDKVLESIPVELLHEVLNCIKVLIANPSINIPLTSNLPEIINEDKGLLQRFANDQSGRPNRHLRITHQ